MNVIDAPARITRGEAFAWSATVIGQDWTGWTGTVTFRRNRQRRMTTPGYGFLAGEADPFLTEAVTGNAAGLLSFNLTAAETDLFPALNRMGWFAQAKAEVSMTNGTDVRKYQFRVSVADSLT
jgi:hypothetical protein